MLGVRYALAVLVLVGCSSPGPGDAGTETDGAAPIDGGFDAAAPHDGGGGSPDAGVDAANTADATGSPDAGPDASADDDAGTDAAAPDAAAPDAGTDAAASDAAMSDAGADAAIMPGVLLHDMRSEPMPLGAYRAFRGSVSAFQVEYFGFVLDVPSRVRIDLMGNARAELDDAQIAAGDATPTTGGWTNPMPSSWRVEDVDSTPNQLLCWAWTSGLLCASIAPARMHYLRTAAASDGNWDGDQVLPAGTYSLAVARGAASSGSLYYYGEIDITPM